MASHLHYTRLATGITGLVIDADAGEATLFVVKDVLFNAEVVVVRLTVELKAHLPDLAADSVVLFVVVVAVEDTAHVTAAVVGEGVAVDEAACGSHPGAGVLSARVDGLHPFPHGLAGGAAEMHREAHRVWLRGVVELMGGSCRRRVEGERRLQKVGVGSSKRWWSGEFR